MSQVLDRTRNGVDTAADVRHARRDQGRPGARRLPVPRQQPLDRRRAQPLHDQGFYGAGQEDASRAEAFTIDAGEPAVLLGTDTGPNPAEAPAARARGVPHDDARLRRGGAQGAA